MLNDIKFNLKCGVYRIRNLINGCIYIGSSKNFYNRLKYHLSLLHKNKHTNPYLQNAWNKYGSESFVFEIISQTSQTSPKVRQIKEQLYINIFLKNNPRSKLYNIATIVDSPNIVQTERVKQFKLNILEFCIDHNYKPSEESKDLIEKKLGKCLRSYSNNYLGSNCYDPLFAKLVFKYLNKKDFMRNKIQNEVREFIRKHGYKPRFFITPREHKLARILHMYTARGGPSYNPKFEQEMDKCLTRNKYLVAKIKKKILDFCVKNGFYPSSTVNRNSERILGRAFYRYRCKGSFVYDPEFVKITEKYISRHKYMISKGIK